MTIDKALRDDMQSKGVDIDLTLATLQAINKGAFSRGKAFAARRLPAVDGKRVIDTLGRISYTLQEKDAADRLGALGMGIPLSVTRDGAWVRFGRADLVALGRRLMDRAAYGILNGGSATSYVDRKKNEALGQGLLSGLEGPFALLEPLCRGLPKGMTPAYINPDGSPGEDFLTLKARAILLEARRFQDAFGKPKRPVLPMYQMTSSGTDAPLAEHYRSWRAHPWIAPLASSLGQDFGGMETAVQGLIAAFTHSEEGSPRRVFSRAFGKEDSCVALPGGHGQCFHVLAPVFRSLRERGYRFAWLGNVDNTGYLPDPLPLAILALSGKPAIFEFCHRTPMDVKGGVLAEDERGRISAVDIGPAISAHDLSLMEAKGGTSLFNCAIGLFDLDILVPMLAELSERLPVRVSDQDKDAGRYSQAEQVTWEVMGILDSPIALAVDKYERFIAAKLLVETILTSGIKAPSLAGSLKETAAALASGLSRKLEGPYGLARKDGRWEAV